MTTCLECGAHMRVKRETIAYDEAGIPGVTLVGVNVYRCPKCGTYEVEIPRPEELLKIIGEAVVLKDTRLTAREVTFLRKRLGLSATDLAARMGVSRETVSRWERALQPIGPQADRLLRLMVVRQDHLDRFDMATMQHIAERDVEKPPRLRLRSADDHWRVLAAGAQR